MNLRLPATVWYEISINQPQEVKIEKQKTQYDLSLTIEKKNDFKFLWLGVTERGV